MQKRGKHISKYFERPEGTQEDVAEMDGLRNCACSFLQHKTFFLREKACLLQAVVCLLQAVLYRSKPL
jgi:hypothetical protein